MKELIVVRHGNPDPGGELSFDGTVAVRQLAERIRPYVQGREKVGLFSSRLPRAAQTAEVLSEWLLDWADAVYTPLLGSDQGGEDVDDLALFNWLSSQEDRFDTVILVCHDSCARTFPGFYSKRKLGRPIDDDRRVVGYAHGTVVHCHEQVSATLV